MISGNWTDYWWNKTVDRIYLSWSSICFGLKTRKGHISKGKFGLSLRIVGFKNKYIIKYSQNGRQPGKGSVAFSILCPHILFAGRERLVKRHALTLRGESVCLISMQIKQWNMKQAEFWFEEKTSRLIHLSEQNPYPSKTLFVLTHHGWQQIMFVIPQA